MLIGIIGENCSGKTMLAEKIKAELGAEILSGKDWLRMAKSEDEARMRFREKLKDAVSGNNLIYVIAEPEHLALLPEGAVRILVSADLDTIKERFRARMHGNLPVPVEKMLEKKHGIFDDTVCDFRYDGTKGDPVPLCEALKKADGRIR